MKLIFVFLLLTGCSAQPPCAHVSPLNPLVSLGDRVVWPASQMTQRHKAGEVSYISVGGVWNGNKVPVFIEPTHRDMVICTEKECSATVSRRGQYGQDHFRTKRFIVLHNKAKHSPYQRLFTQHSGLPIPKQIGWCLMDF